MNRMTDKIHEMGLKLPKPFIYPSPNRTGCVVTGETWFIHLVTLHLQGSASRSTARLEEILRSGKQSPQAQAAALNILASVELNKSVLWRLSNKLSKLPDW